MTESKSTLLDTLAQIADDHAISIEALWRSAERGYDFAEDILLDYGIYLNELNLELAIQADEYNRTLTRKLLEKYGIGKPRFAGSYDKSEFFDGHETRRKSKRRKIFGLSIVKLVQWLWADCWTFTEIMLLMERLDVEVKPATIRTQIAAAKRLGRRRIFSRIRLQTQQQLHLYTVIEDK